MHCSKLTILVHFCNARIERSKCVGLGVMDSAISALVLAHADQQGLGWTVDF